MIKVYLEANREAANGEGCFIYEVQHPRIGQWVCLDVFGTLGRLINLGGQGGHLKSHFGTCRWSFEGGIFSLQEHTSWQRALV